MQDFSEPGLKDTESGKLQKSAEAAIERARWGKEQRDGGTIVYSMYCSISFNSRGLWRVTPIREWARGTLTQKKIRLFTWSTENTKT
jgi:hypothetical protein